MIEIENVHKRFNPGTLNEVYALRGVSVTIREGEFVTVIGTNGSGKSTLLNAVAGSFLPDSGTIRISGEDVTRLRDFQRARHVARVFQDPYKGTAPDMSIAENLHMAFLRNARHHPRIGLKGSRMEEYRERIRLLEMQLEGRLDDLIGTLSGGQRQALTLLMAVIGRPEVLLLDEHTAALDPKSARQVVDLTKKFVEQGNLTTLMVTHSMQQALELGSRTIMMHRGEVIDDISSQEKKRSTVEELLERFAELRKAEKLTPEMLEELRREYV
jgi:putative ABC transport system ATP-binding protein